MKKDSGWRKTKDGKVYNIYWNEERKNKGSESESHVKDDVKKSATKKIRGNKKNAENNNADKNAEAKENVFAKDKIKNSEDLADSIQKHKLDKELLDEDDCVLEDKDVIYKLCEQAGYNERPKLLDKEEFKSLDDKEYIKVARGISDGEKTAEEYIEQYKTGDNTYGSGDVRYGVGTYTAKNTGDADTYGESKLNIAIPKSAKIIEYSKLEQLQTKLLSDYQNNPEKYYDRYGDATSSIMDSFETNISAVAILNGYDAVKTPEDWYLILNRGKVMVEK